MAQALQMVGVLVVLVLILLILRQLSGAALRMRAEERNMLKGMIVLEQRGDGQSCRQDNKVRI